MEDFRSKSYADGRTQMDGYGTLSGPTGLQDLRCYSASYASSSQTQSQVDPNSKMGKSSSVSSRSKKSWILADPELQRKKRVAGYKAYTVEGKVKGSLRKSFRWIKDTCNQVVHGWR